MSKNKRETEAHDYVHYKKTKVSYLQCAIIYQRFVKQRAELPQHCKNIEMMYFRKQTVLDNWSHWFCCCLYFIDHLYFINILLTNIYSVGLKFLVFYVLTIAEINIISVLSMSAFYIVQSSIIKSGLMVKLVWRFQ